MRRRLDHVDLRVTSMALARPFYETLLPGLGFTRDSNIPGWFQFEAADGDVTEFFGVIESSTHIPNETRIAFWAESVDEVDRVAEVAIRAGARKVEGPSFEAYYAVFFEDPCGNRLEICHRKPRQ
jgi:predicted enzyme related to lactoylglutathione lyase